MHHKALWNSTDCDEDYDPVTTPGVVYCAPSSGPGPGPEEGAQYTRNSYVV